MRFQRCHIGSRLLLSIITLLLTVSAAGCAAIKGVSHSNLYADFPSKGTFTVRLLSGDAAVGAKIERMLRHQVEKHGLRFSESDPDLLVAFAFDVVPAGSVSRAHTFIDPTLATATTVVHSTRLFTKTIAVRISRAKTGQKLWDSVVSETGWCNQIFVTAPHILSLMFEEFPKERTNIQKIVIGADEGAQELKRLFPPDTHWGC